ncbi:MAG TPA: VWA domain-containing protein, partial [Myxococcus sp.]|nr:VWA domain-containing protein [Myxococcus sp.]
GAGRKAEAKLYIQKNQALLHEASVIAGPAAVAADQAEQQATMDEYDSADSDEASRAAVKRSKVKALKGFGKMGSTY